MSAQNYVEPLMVEADSAIKIDVQVLTRLVSLVALSTNYAQICM